MGDSIFELVKDTVADLHKVGLVDDVTLKNIESLCVPVVKHYDEMFPPIADGCLLGETEMPDKWKATWERANAHAW